MRQECKIHVHSIVGAFLAHFISFYFLPLSVLPSCPTHQFYLLFTSISCTVLSPDQLWKAPFLWKQLPVWIWETGTISNFKIRLKEQQLSSERLTLISSLPALIYRTHWFGLWTHLDNIAATVFYTGRTEAKQDPTRPAEPTLPTWSDHMIQTGNAFTLKDVAGKVPELWKWNSALKVTGAQCSVSHSYCKIFLCILMSLQHYYNGKQRVAFRDCEGFTHTEDIQHLMNFSMWNRS